MQTCGCYPCFSCRIGRTPWFIAYDNTFDSVVISIRGTWSVKDVVTDILLGRVFDDGLMNRNSISG